MASTFTIVEFPGIQVEEPCVIVIRDATHPYHGVWHGTVTDIIPDTMTDVTVQVVARITGGPVVNATPDPDAEEIDVEDVAYEVVPAHPFLLETLERLLASEAQVRSAASLKSAVHPPSKATLIGLAAQGWPPPRTGDTMQWRPDDETPQLTLPLRIEPMAPVVMHSAAAMAHAQSAPDVAALNAARLTSRTLIGGYSGNR